MENAQLYSSANGMQKRDAQEVILEFFSKLNWTEETEVLDIGCGSGEVTTEIILPHLPKGFKQLVGLDVSQEMIEFAKSNHNRPKLSFVQFDIAQESNNVLEELKKSMTTLENNNLEIKDIENKLAVVSLANVRQNIKILLNDRKILEFNKRKDEKKLRGYDIVVSFYCLHWVQNQRSALKNIYSLLKPGGEALLVLLASSPIFTLYDKLSKSPRWYRYMEDVDKYISPYHHSEAPLEDFMQLVTDAGFKVISSECRERRYVFEGSSTLQSAITAVNPFTIRIPNDIQEEYISDCLKYVEEFNLTEFKNDRHKVSYNLLIAHVRK